LEGIDIKGPSVGKRSRQRVYAKSGRYVASAPVKGGERFFDVALDATLRAALMRTGRPAKPGDPLIQPIDFRKKRYKRPQRTLIVFVVDASDSMGQGTFARMKAAKGAALAILTQARLKRHRVAMVAFRDKSAKVVLQPTDSLSLARRRLNMLPTGGATPFAHGLMKAWRMIKTERLKDPAIRPLMVVISDGEANIPLAEGNHNFSVMDELLLIGERIGRDRIAAVVVDTRPRRGRSEDMVRIARALNGAYHHIDGLKAGNVVALVSALQLQSLAQA
jgi:magnesium chelatase subunit D